MKIEHLKVSEGGLFWNQLTCGGKKPMPESIPIKDNGVVISKRILTLKDS